LAACRPGWPSCSSTTRASPTDRGQVVKTWGGPTDAFDYTLDEPWGVIAVIVPWNGPFVSFGQTLAPALAAGNTVVIKPPEFAPYSCLRLGQIATEAGFRQGSST